ncbi:unnamed protein product [Symbiodinium necroappetens]|uniref:Ammonium transporter AmtB-like domain-containing protein n=1 Tax=Symbiodinium necroappetens TaxID=1628268 RepID=A0A812YS81_9DINO|nr:unnamed protein product [Symbiodinium necroappetens]
MKVCLAAALAAAFTATAMSQDSPAELLRELQAQRELLEEQRKELKQMTETQESMAGAMDSAWLVLCGALVMFMHAGFAMLETGCCRAKNASNVLMKNLVNVSVGTLGWWIFGWAFAYGSQAGSFIGTDGFFGLGFYNKDASGNIVPVECEDGACQSTMLSWFFQWAFCTAGATIVSGCVAERVKSPTYAVFAFCMTSFGWPTATRATTVVLALEDALRHRRQSSSRRTRTFGGVAPTATRGFGTKRAHMQDADPSGSTYACTTRPFSRRTLTGSRSSSGPLQSATRSSRRRWRKPVRTTSPSRRKATPSR